MYSLFRIIMDNRFETEIEAESTWLRGTDVNETPIGEFVSVVTFK